MHPDHQFTALVDQFYGPLYRFAHSLTGSEADACDLVQETFYIWARKGSQLRQASKAKSWLFTTLHREFLQRHRHTSRFPQTDLDSAVTELPSIPPAGLARLDARRVVHFLKQVDEVFQGPLSLFYLEDCSYEEIAVILELPLGTVKSRLSRGVAQLKRWLAADLAIEGPEHRE